MCWLSGIDSLSQIYLRISISGRPTWKGISGGTPAGVGSNVLGPLSSAYCCGRSIRPIDVCGTRPIHAHRLTNICKYRQTSFCAVFCHCRFFFASHVYVRVPLPGLLGSIVLGAFFGSSWANWYHLGTNVLISSMIALCFAAIAGSFCTWKLV